MKERTKYLNILRKKFASNNFGKWKNGEIINEKDFIYGTLDNKQIKEFNDYVYNGISKAIAYELVKDSKKKLQEVV